MIPTSENSSFLIRNSCFEPFYRLLVRNSSLDHSSIEFKNSEDETLGVIVGTVLQVS